MSDLDARAIIGRFLDYFGDNGCSDIHMSAGRGLWYVKDKATLHMADSPVPITAELVTAIVAAFLPGGLERFERDLQGDASIDVGSKYRGRLAVRHDIEGASLTIRIISRDVPTIERVGLTPSLVNSIRQPSGLLLFTGQTGSGKSSSIAALLNLVNLTESSSIYTLESPVEFVYPHAKSLVVQREVGSQVASFAVGVENAKRSHPKIILVGEILNAETARAALSAAASGHLVVSTMHAGSTAETVDGLIAMFPPAEQALIRTQLAQVLIGIVVQQLIPRTGGGLALAQEVAFNTREFSELILGGDMKLAQQMLLGQGQAAGMVSMEASLDRLVGEGHITPELAAKTARDRKTMNDFLTRRGINVKDLS
ncbi:type IV pilus twitching motility protein PilT [Agromyces humi]|uniref:type IV pilus twitching motility protein PilT n=1 Tax=Agromyces humi TaxID=1766800 RepID=UPI00135C65DB|nr:ATPase, T2SS/T4P/T4SS family [Agromyces humi]